jgi:PEP-CTERM motif
VGTDQVTLTGSVSSNITPLPSTWTMLIAGFVGLGFFAYRGTKKNAAALAA